MIVNVGKIKEKYLKGIDLNEHEKVFLLEETVRTGTIDDLKEIIRKLKRFEMTSRALGLASRYRGLDFVKILIQNGATFSYRDSVSDEQMERLQRYYHVYYRSESRSYFTLYYLMMVPNKISGQDRYSPMVGIPSFINDDPEDNVLGCKERLEIAEYCAGQDVGISLDEMLFWALTHCETEFADGLISMGADLKTDAPGYYDPPMYSLSNYHELITTGKQSIYWTNYMTWLSNLTSDELLDVFERLNTIAASDGKKLLLSQTLFDDLNWDSKSFAFALENMDLSKINRKQAMEKAVKMNSVKVLELMANQGWLKMPNKRDALIEYAQNEKITEALAWLLDYKNRTADLAKETKYEIKKAVREFNEKPDSVSALKKIWSYKKQEDGTLIITGYKGTDSKVTVPSKIGKTTVSSIGDYAFTTSWGCSSRVNAEVREARKRITEIEIGNGITTIGKGAFFECSSLKNVKIPDSVTSIGKSAFQECSNLTDVTIPNSVTSIGENAFCRCSSLVNVTIPNRVTSIGAYAFSFCGSLTSVNIPSSVTIIGKSAFQGCSNLTDVAIPDSVSSIGESAFQGCSSLTNVKIPDHIKAIGVGAFAECNKLADKDGFIIINKRLFDYIEKVTNAVIPSSVTIIWDHAFYHCSSLTSVIIPNSVTSIGVSAFSGCSSLKNVTIPDSVTSIGESAFSFCSSLTSVNIPNSVTSIGAGAFSFCSSLTSVTIQGSVTSIGYRAFQGCNALKSITIEEGVTSIGSYAIADCTALTSITIPDSLTSIGNSAFSGCYNLTGITIPKGVKSIGDSAFSGCSSLTSITVPEGVTRIGDWAFKGCKGLSDPNGFVIVNNILFDYYGPGGDVFIPEGVTRIGNGAFSDCNALTGITLPESVRSIGNWAFCNCSSLTSITLPERLTSIGDRAFSGCSALTSVNIPNSVTSIGADAFTFCRNLKEVTIPDSVTEIGNNAFDRDVIIKYSTSAEAADRMQN